MAAFGRLLCAAALAAGAAAGEELEDGDPGTIEAERSPARDEDTRGTALGAAAQLSASARGGRELSLVAHLLRGGARISAGAESISGPNTPERRGVVLGAELEVGEDAAVQLDARVVPAQEQMSRAAGEAWVRIGRMAAGVLARRTSLGTQRLDALGAGIDVSADVLGVDSALRVVAWRIDLTAPRSRDPWTPFGRRTLDWADRWQADLSARRAFGPVAVTAVAAASQSPLQHVLVSAGAGIEWRIGPALLSAALAAARGPDGVAPEITAAVAVGAVP
jgi:hypothetical protein